jgi:SAM-dependent methyltransferase
MNIAGWITDTVRESYDRLADEYARRLFCELDKKPFDRLLLDRFAHATTLRGKVCDVGCGPGEVADYLAKAGARVVGLDLSPQMLEHARHLNPDLSFIEGNMMSLPFKTAELAGIAAFYAIVNVPPEYLSRVFEEMHRVLQLDGLLLLAFHVGNGRVSDPESWTWGHRISMDWFLFPTAEVRRLLEAAGFRIEDVIERDPYPPEVEDQTRRAYIFARRRRTEEGSCRCPADR